MTEASCESLVTDVSCESDAEITSDVALLDVGEAYGVVIDASVVEACEVTLDAEIVVAWDAGKDSSPINSIVTLRSVISLPAMSAVKNILQGKLCDSIASSVDERGNVVYSLL